MTVIKLEHLTKIEGHASLTVKIDEGKVQKVELAVVEGARFIEGIIKGRRFDEVHLVVQRICGICSVSHTLACLKAIENALGIVPSNQTKMLRELMEIGAHIQSHSLHLYLLALPDYLGYGSALEMAGKYRKEVVRGLGLKKLGNEIDAVIGGRVMHPVTPCIGGFRALPEQGRLEALQRQLERARADAYRTVALFASLAYPKFRRRTDYVCMHLDDSYALSEGTIMFSNGLEIPESRYASYLREDVMPYSNAKFSSFEKRSYYVGALARLNNNFELLSKGAQKCMDKLGVRFPSFNPYHNNIAQAVELVHHIDRAVEILKSLKLADEEPAAAKPRAGRGVGIVEAPRGLLIHDYRLDSKGNIAEANVVTPTAQNLRNIEDDLYKLLPKMLDRKQKEIVFEAERLIRAYDPCISCSAHFLEFKGLEQNI